jgi:predicted nuclease of predicted toxin-antitoxin system
LHLRDEGLHRLPDPQIFDEAIAEQRIVLTFDVDFGEIAALVRGRLTSVILFRLHDTRAGHVIERLASTLAVSAAALDVGAIVIVEESRHCVRHLPIRKDEPESLDCAEPALP